MIAVEHLVSVDVPSVNAVSLFKKMKALFAKRDLPWENLLVLLMDSAGLMHGDKFELEVCIRQLALHLLDIDRDLYHHMHNIVQNVNSYFVSFVERLLQATSDYTDFKHFANSLESLKKLTFHLNWTFQNRQITFQQHAFQFLTALFLFLT